jgi:hypothetical protein
MSLANFFIRAGDQEPFIRGELRDATGAAINLSETTVRFVMVDEQGQEVVNALATQIDEANGIVEYQWAAGDTDTPGLYLARWVITTSGFHQMTVPNNGDLLIQVF